ncbi:Secreted enzyme, contains two amidohydrolase related domains [hydrothermal vent metagenome]|uniref:Secreted enzyme, contains two amidohydrolase related domains n=1 Tax=hydrothermal vent metagenome TaxID=652676 RepID=A0A3B0VIM1_9ZZZZ
MHASVWANQLPTATINGTKDERHAIYALTNAHIFVDSNTELDNATILIQDHKILNVGKSISIPANAVVLDLYGANIYPGFILLDSNYGLSKVGKRAPFSFFAKEILASTTEGAVNTNEAIKASYRAINDFHHDKDQAKQLRKNGFGTVLSSKHDGIMRGTSVLVSLDDKADQQSIIKQEQAFWLSFDKGSSKQLYPISLMGASALLRQTWLDANWYGKGKANFTDLDLQAINANKSKLHIFAVNSWQQVLLADKIAKEANKNIILRTAGDTYKHIDAIKKLNQSLIVPVSFPKALEVSDELDAQNVSLEKMMQWEAAPYNLYYLHKNNIEFSIAPNIKDQKTFLQNLRKAITKGLPKSAALTALTATPAKMLNNPKLGHLNRGAIANLIIAEGDLFSKDGRIAENWVAGERFIINRLAKIKSGVYQLNVKGVTHELEIVAKGGKLTLKSTNKDSKVKYTATTDNDFITIEIKDETVKDEENSSKLMGLLTHNSMQNIQGQLPLWSANRVADIKKDDKKDKKTKDKVPNIPQPFSAYGLHKPATADSYLLTNATIWTNEVDGILTASDVFIKNGKIIKIGQNLSVKADRTIDATDMHLTAGIIDEHSHIALLSVNDIAVNSAMVRMQDALDSDNINIYRNLAGGVTAAQLLHGSANPIGGQSALIKMRWGATGDELLIKAADKFIKFALGENVKRSVAQESIRYPLTRMGVEQVYRDAFANARVYEKQWQTYNKLSKRAKKQTTAPRRDLMMDATLEVINKNRFVTAHSYVQSEINMLMQVADDFNFNINTFTHILEGYKVADKMLAHGAGASSFSDWWAYKWEVNYAIPYNAAIMAKVGITTAINSDSPEMARRLNQEAAKSIKYGNLTEQQALKLVTLNPAKLLHLDDRMGSIKVGKDADIVLWSNNPLSIYAKANKTFVDGKLLYDRDKQVAIEAQIAKERERLIKKINASDEPKKPAMMPPKKHMQCDSITGYEYLSGAGQ